MSRISQNNNFFNKKLNYVQFFSFSKKLFNLGLICVEHFNIMFFVMPFNLNLLRLRVYLQLTMTDQLGVKNAKISFFNDNK